MPDLNRCPPVPEYLATKMQVDGMVLFVYNNVRDHVALPDGAAKVSFGSAMVPVELPLETSIFRVPQSSLNK